MMTLVSSVSDTSHVDRLVIYNCNMFIKQATDVNVVKRFSSSLTEGQNKLECLSLTRFSGNSNIYVLGEPIKWKNLGRIHY